MMTESSPKDYWISPSALYIEKNAMGRPDYIMAACTSGTKILVYVQGIIGYDAGHNYQRWTLEASPTAFMSHEEKYVYAAIPKSEEVGKNALVVFPSERIDIYGKNAQEEQIGLDTYYYIFLQGILSSSGDNGTENRVWKQNISTGYLSSDEAINAGPSEAEWFDYSMVSGLVTFLKNLTMKAGTFFEELFASALTVVSGGRITFEGQGDIVGKAQTDTALTDDERIVTPKFMDENALSKKHDDSTDFDLGMKNLSASGNASVRGNIDVFGNAILSQDALIKGSLTVGTAEVPSQALIRGDLEVGTYNKGMQGAKVDFYGNAEFESIVGRSFLEVPELRYNRTTITVGNKWQTQGAGIIEKVWTNENLSGLLSSSYEGIAKLKLETGEIGAIAVGDKCQGVFHFLSQKNDVSTADTKDGNFHFSGFTTIYFLIKEIYTDETLPQSVKDTLEEDETIGDNQYFRYELRAATCANLPAEDRNRWTDASHPQSTMHFAAYANESNSDRQSSRLTTTTYQLHLAGMTGWTYTQDNIRLIIGWLDGFSFLQRVWDKEQKKFVETTKELTGEGIATGNMYMWGSIDQFDRVPSLISQQLYFKSSVALEMPPDGIKVADTHLSYELNGWTREPITPSVTDRIVWQQWLYTYSDGTYSVSDVAFHAADPTALTVVLNKNIVSLALSDWYDASNPDDVQFDITAQIISGTTPLKIKDATAQYGDDETSSPVSLIYTTQISEDGLFVTYHINLKGYVGVAVEGVAPEDAFLTLTLQSDYGTQSAVATIAQNREGEDGQNGSDGTDGKDGEDALQFSISPLTITTKPSDEDQLFRVEIRVTRGDSVLYVNTDYEMSTPIYPSVLGLNDFDVQADGVFYYEFKLFSNSQANGDISFNLTDLSSRIIYPFKVAFATVMDGEQGPQGEQGKKGDKGDQGEKGDKGDPGARGYTGITVRRGEWEEGVYYRNDSEDGSTADDGKRYLDEVSVTDLAGGTAKWYLARTAHNGSLSTIANKPSGNGNDYWELINDMRPIKTSYADIMTAFIQFLQVNQIQVTEDDGTPYGAFGGGKDMDYPLWFGGKTPEEAVAKFNRKGDTWFGKNFSVVGDDVNITGTLHTNALYIREGGFITTSGKKYLNLSEHTGNYFVLPDNENIYLPDPTDYEGMEVTVLFGAGTNATYSGLSCDQGIFAPYYRMTEFEGSTITGSLQALCIVSDERLASLTLVASNSYRTGLVWTVVGHSGIVYFPRQATTAEVTYKNDIQLVYLPDGRLVNYVG